MWGIGNKLVCMFMYLIRKYETVQEETENFERVKNEESFQIECGQGRPL